MITGADDGLLRPGCQRMAALLAKVFGSRSPRATARATDGIVGLLSCRTHQRLPATTTKTQVIRKVQIARCTEHKFFLLKEDYCRLFSPRYRS